MREQIHVQESAAPGPDDAEVEIVERKGLGHPDTICDLVMEHISQTLSQAYLAHYGRILHHNCDKSLLVAGKVQRQFGGGRVLEPLRLVIGDRATFVKDFDVTDLATKSAGAWFRSHLPTINPDKHLLFQVELKGGSDELAGIFGGRETILPANDTSAAVGYAPLTETERLVLEAEKFLNGADFKKLYPASGTDVKVMAIRTGARLHLTIAMPVLDRYVENERSYFRHKEEWTEALLSHLRARLGQLTDVAVDLNTLDRPGAELSGMYLSVLGTSAEDADSGQVGRGNQVNGIIALNRPRGSEAAAGKNPVSHVGKIYNVLTHLLADQIYREVPGLRQVVVWLCSRIGDPVNQPEVAAVQIKMAPPTKFADVAEPVRSIVDRELQRMPSFCDELAMGKYSIC